LNDYGQLHKSSIGQAVDSLLEAYTLEAFGVYASPDDDPPMEQGGKRRGEKVQGPQHQLNTDGITITQPAVYAEKQSFERVLWKLLRRQHARLCDLGEGLCLRCREVNDQPRRRFCSKCEEVMR
jgi:hypothetical protein